MVAFTADQLGVLANEIEATDRQINQAASQSLNRGATFARQLTTTLITQETTLQQSYVNRNIRTAKRASPNDLLSIVRANTRETLLTRFEHRQTNEGVIVRVNRQGPSQLIRGAFILRGLRNSGASGIGLRNRQAVQAFQQGLSPATRGKRRKLQRIISNARTNPRGILILHSRSINQLFTTAREDAAPRIERFLADNFLQQLQSQIGR